MDIAKEISSLKKKIGSLEKELKDSSESVEKQEAYLAMKEKLRKL